MKCSLSIDKDHLNKDRSLYPPDIIRYTFSIFNLVVRRLNGFVKSYKCSKRMEMKKTRPRRPIMRAYSIETLSTFSTLSTFRTLSTFNALSKLNCTDDFHKENCPFLAFEKKKQVTDRPSIHPTDGRTDGRTHPHIEMGGPI